MADIWTVKQRLDEVRLHLRCLTLIIDGLHGRPGYDKDIERTLLFARQVMIELEEVYVSYVDATSSSK